MKSLSEKEIEEQRLQEIYLLLSQLFKREEVTAKAIAGCLYDIATVNLINRYVSIWGINQTLKYLTRFPRPIAQSLAVKLYVQPKCPQLITEWMYTLVEFPVAAVQSVEVQLDDPNSLPALEQERKQVKSLQGKVKLLTGTLLTTIVLFTGSFMWVANNLQVSPIELLTTSQPRQTIDN